MPSGLKTGVKNDIFWSKIGDLENRAAQPHQEFPGVPPPPRFVVCDVHLRRRRWGWEFHTDPH